MGVGIEIHNIPLKIIIKSINIILYFQKTTAIYKLWFLYDIITAVVFD